MVKQETTLGSYSEDPRGHNSSNPWQTSAGAALFYKVTYGQVIN